MKLVVLFADLTMLKPFSHRLSVSKRQSMLSDLMANRHCVTRVGNGSVVHNKQKQLRAIMSQSAGDERVVNYKGGQPCFKERTTKVSSMTGAGNGGQE